MGNVEHELDNMGIPSVEEAKHFDMRFHTPIA
jgi:hypothetical protein